MMFAQGGEDVTYTKRGGGSRTVKAVVTYPGPDSMTAPSSLVAPTVNVLVCNNSTTGISSTEVDRGGDTITVPLRIGKGAKVTRIIAIESQNEGFVELLCR